MREPTSDELKSVVRLLQMSDALRGAQVDVLVGSLRRHIALLKSQDNLSGDLAESLASLDTIMTSQHKHDETIEMLEKSLRDLNRAITR